MSITVSDPSTPHLGGNYMHGDLACMSFTMWELLIKRYAIRSVLDIGCGEGHAVRFFHGLGVFAHGIEGLRRNVERAVVPITLHDLTAGPYTMPVDMTLSIEVAEHIEERFVDHYLDTLANGKIVVMTHAVPGQGGFHHVNCQPSEYWTAKMEARGYALDPHTQFWRDKSKADGHFTYFSNSGLVFKRRS